MRVQNRQCRLLRHCVDIELVVDTVRADVLAYQIVAVTQDTVAVNNVDQATPERVPYVELRSTAAQVLFSEPIRAVRVLTHGADRTSRGAGVWRAGTTRCETRNEQEGSKGRADGVTGSVLGWIERHGHNVELSNVRLLGKWGDTLLGG